MTFLRELSKAAKLGALATLVVAGGAIGGVVATSGSAPHPAKTVVVQRSATDAPTTTAPALPAPTTTTTAPAPPASTGAGSVGVTGPTAPPATPATTTTAPTPTAGTGTGSVDATGPSGTSPPTPAPTATTTTAPQTVIVPNVVGDTVTAAEAALTAAGLTSDKQTQPGCTAGVVSQSPLAGASAPRGTQVVFRVDDANGMAGTRVAVASVCG
ncbi:MAG: PASTA domain-containing protein [Acidimicrobiales bacterium]